ncbi:MAG: glycosyl hydrolase [candidate division KSB1 bacterium]|nr:glycosyl hydrolase [candidate division KSB1 bacterium]
MRYKCFVLFAVLISTFGFSADFPEFEELAAGFDTIPLPARPRALWDWVDGNFSHAEITRELEAAHAKGLGGFDIWDVASRVDEDHIVPEGPAFMSEPYVDAICHALREAERLGLDIGLIISSGWNAGGAWTAPEHQTMGLFTSSVTIQGPGPVTVDLPFPKLPDKAGKPGREREAIISRQENGEPVFSKEITVLAIPVSVDSMLPIKHIYDVSDKFMHGTLEWDAPSGDWRIIRAVCANTGQPMISATPNSHGPMIDHFNPEAAAAHLDYFFDKLEAKLGDLSQTALKYLYTDSYEVRGQLWSPHFINQFRDRYHYDLTPYIPALLGYTVESQEITRRFLYDYDLFLSDMIIDGHYKTCREICEQHGIQFVAEAAGPGQPVHNCPFESLKSSGVLSFPRGEFWQQHRNDEMIDLLQVIKGVASAAHIYDQTYVEAEAFTGTYLWQYGPGDLKSTADRAFCEGLNRIIFHTWPHTPEAAGEPGWIYSFGTLMHETRVWWPLADSWMQYLGRCSYLLQQGNFVGDVLYYYGDKAPNFVPAKHMDPHLGFGYDYDVTNMDVLVNRLTVENGKLTLPHGQTYKVLVLPGWKHMNLNVLKKLELLVKQGAVVMGRKPETSHGLYQYKDRENEIRVIADRLWGKTDGETVTRHEYGKGMIVWGEPLRNILLERGVEPDFTFTGPLDFGEVDYIHRRTRYADVYFVRNKPEKSVTIQGDFRCGNIPELWNPLSGTRMPAPIYTHAGSRTYVPLQLPGHGSLFVVFRDGQETSHITSVIRDDLTVYPSAIPSDMAYVPSTMRDGSLVFQQDGKYQLLQADSVLYVLKVDEPQEPKILTGAWSVTFPESKKGPGTIRMDSLYSWSLHPDDAVRFFSGVAEYERSFDLKKQPEHRVLLDLGRVEKIAQVFVNDKPADVIWCEPYACDITDFLRSGENILRIQIANTWANRLAGDARLTPSERITRTNITRLPNAWAVPMQEVPNEDYQLPESGLLGPVKVHSLKVESQGAPK